MRTFITFILVSQFMVAGAQNKDSIAAASIQYPVQGYVLLVNGSKIGIEGISYLDSSNVVLFTPGPNVINGVYTYKGDIRTMKKTTVSINQIRLLKARRQGFIRGASVSGGAGFAVGFGAGYFTHLDYDKQHPDENGLDRNGWGFIGGVALGVPAALAGGLGGSIFTRKRFPIDGDALCFQKSLQRIFK